METKEMHFPVTARLITPRKRR